MTCVQLLLDADVAGRVGKDVDAEVRCSSLDALVGSGPSVVVGYDCERAYVVGFISSDYKDVNSLQAYRRGSRGTRTTPLRVIFVQYANSVDQRKYQIVKVKSEMAHKVDPTRKILEVAWRLLRLDRKSVV